MRTLRFFCARSGDEICLASSEHFVDFPQAAILFLLISKVIFTRVRRPGILSNRANSLTRIRVDASNCKNFASKRALL